MKVIPNNNLSNNINTNNVITTESMNISDNINQIMETENDTNGNSTQIIKGHNLYASATESCFFR